MINANRSVLVISAIVNQEHATELQDYLGQVMQIFQKFGGKPISRFKTVENLLGEESPEMLAVLEFPDDVTIKDMVRSNDFIRLSELRQRVFSKLNMIISVTF